MYPQQVMRLARTECRQIVFQIFFNFTKNLFQKRSVSRQQPVLDQPELCIETVQKSAGPETHGPQRRRLQSRLLLHQLVSVQVRVPDSSSSHGLK